MADNSLSDEKLVKNALRGDESAFSQLYDRYHRLVYSAAYRFLQNAGEAQDATQEIFIKLYRTLQNWNSSKSHFHIWAYRIAVNHAIDCWRSRNYRAESQLDENTVEYILREQSIGGAARSPFCEMEQKEGVALLKQCVDSLPDLQKKIFILRYFQDLKLVEIAEIGNCSLGTVKSSLFRATQTVRKLLGRSKG
jgi:RNA polymerase sigma-70 factor (ECF subfamily)